MSGYNGSTQTNVYSGDGMRATKAGTRAGKYLYDDNVPVIEFTASNEVSNTFGPDGLVSRHVLGGVTTFYTFDERGNVSQRLTNTGSISSTDAYDVYGTRSSTVSAQPDPWGYEAEAGYYTDTETGLILCTNRFYDPATGRFVTRDPIGYDGGINLYGYVGNDPVNDTDPEGTETPVLTPPPIYLPPAPTTAPTILRIIGGLIAAGAGTIVATVAGVGLLIAGAKPAGPAHEFPPSHYKACPIQNGRQPSKKSGKDQADDVPSWSRYCRPKGEDETCQEWAAKMLDEQYGVGGWSKKTSREFSQMVKGCERGAYSWSK